MISSVVVFDGRVTEVVYDDISVVARRDGYRERWDLCATFSKKKPAPHKRCDLGHLFVWGPTQVLGRLSEKHESSLCPGLSMGNVPWDGTVINCSGMGMGQINMSHGQL